MRKKINLPVSISELNYENNDLFKIIMSIAILASAFGGLYISAGCFALVYVFRYFHNSRQLYFHYLAAIGGFISACAGIGDFTPLWIGAGAAVVAYLSRNMSYVFIFEIVASILILTKLY